MLDRYCVTCHNQRLATAGLKLDEADVANPGEGAEIWEKVVRKLRTGMMPPPNMPQPSMDDRRALLSWLETSLDKAAAAKPNPGRTETLRRLNRTEYQNAIRDLLSVDIDAASLLPADESGHGFDNVTVGDLPPALLDRYISAAQKISALAIGSTQTSLQSDIIRVPPDVTQEGHVAGLPIGTRGGVSVPYTFAQDGEYDIQIYLARGYSGDVDGLEGPAAPRDQVVARPDADRRIDCPETCQRRRRAHRQESEDSRACDGRSASGRRHVSQEFLFSDRNSASAPPVAVQRETSSAHDSGDFPGLRHRAIRAAGSRQTPSRRRIFVCRPSRQAPRTDEDACAKKILSTLMRRAYRRSISEADLERPMAFYREGKSERRLRCGHRQGVERCAHQSRIPVPRGGGSRQNARPVPPTASAISSWHPACHFFSGAACPMTSCSIRPFAASSAGQTCSSDTSAECSRILARTISRATSPDSGSGCATWTSVDPNVRLYPDFDDNLRQAFRLETELFVDSVVREDRSVLDLLRADYTFLNERLAKHYGIPNVYGSRFRRVELGARQQARRIAAAGQHPRRLVLCDADVACASWRVGLEQHRRRAAAAPASECAGARRTTCPPTCQCARGWPPIAPVPCARAVIGRSIPWDSRWRISTRSVAGGTTKEDSGPIDVSGALPGLGDVNGVAGLEEALLRRPELFAATLTEKLLTFALGRGVEYYDAPAVRQDSPRGPARWLPLLVAHSGNRQQCAVSDEEIVMIITKKALPRRTFLKGVQATLALPLLDAMIPAVTALAKTPAKPVSPARLRVHPDGMRPRSVDATR